MRDKGCVSLFVHMGVDFHLWLVRLGSIFMLSAYKPWHFTDWHQNQRTLNCGFTIFQAVLALIIEPDLSSG